MQQYGTVFNLNYILCSCIYILHYLCVRTLLPPPFCLDEQYNLVSYSSIAKTTY